MKIKLKIALLSLVFVGILAASIVYIATHKIAVLDPSGMIGVKEKDLIITASLLMLIVVIPVFFFALFFLWKYRESNLKARHEPDWEHNSIAEYCWWGVPLLIVAILAVITWKSSHDLSPFKPIENGKKPIEIQVVALEWKWLFIYPEEKIATINYIQIPKDTPIAFAISADAPMNSFWVPELGGQIYAMPAMRSKLHLIANREGNFRGASANISGKGFAGRTFTVKSSDEETYQSWVEKVKNSGKVLDTGEYDKLLVPSERHPVEYFTLGVDDLFDQIIMKYMRPQK